jgi:hypothetical protein
MNGINNEVVYHQALESIRFLARTSKGSVTDILDNIERDVLSGKYEKTPMPADLRFWDSKVSGEIERLTAELKEANDRCETMNRKPSDRLDGTGKP